MKNYAFRREVLSIEREERDMLRSPNMSLSPFVRHQILSILYAIERGVSLKAIAEYWDICPSTVKARVRDAIWRAEEEIILIEYNERQARSWEEMDKAIDVYNKQFKTDSLLSYSSDPGVSTFIEAIGL